MMLQKKTRNIGLILILMTVPLFALRAASAEDVKISTYYPAPYGSYDELTSESKTLLATNPITGVAGDANAKVGIGTTVPAYKLDVAGTAGLGQTYLKESTLLFSDPNHAFTAIGNTDGYAAIENDVNRDTLMIMGRSGGIGGVRSVSIYDRLDVNGFLRVFNGAFLTINDPLEAAVQGVNNGTGSLGSLGVGVYGVYGITHSNSFAGYFRGDSYGVLGGSELAEGYAGLFYNYASNYFSILGYQNYGLYSNGVVSALNVAPSDSRKKTDIATIPNALDKVSALRGVNFKWKEEKPLAGQQMGLIAQEVETVFPELVTDDPTGYKALNYTGLSGALVEAIKELKLKNEALEKETQLLKERIEKLENK